MRFDDPAPVAAMREVLMVLVAGLRVSTQYPADGRLPHVRLDYLGGRPENPITDGPRFGIQVYARNSTEAERVTGQVKAALMGLNQRSVRTSSGHKTRGWSFESVMDFPDPDRPTLARWQIMGRLGISMLRPA